MKRLSLLVLILFICFLPLLMAPTGGYPSRPKFRTITVGSSGGTAVTATFNGMRIARGRVTSAASDCTITAGNTVDGAFGTSGNCSWLSAGSWLFLTSGWTTDPVCIWSTHNSSSGVLLNAGINASGNGGLTAVTDAGVATDPSVVDVICIGN